MSLLGKLFGSGPVAAGGGGALASDEHWLALRGGAATRAGIAVTTDSAQALPAVAAAIGIIADQVGQLPLHVYEETRSGGKVRVTEHPTAAVLKLEPNERTTSIVFRRTVQAHVLAWGNGYAEIERNGRDQAVALWQLLPDRTEPELRGGALRYRTRVDGTQLPLAAANVLHLKNASFDGILGRSPIALHREALGLARATEQFGASWFGNGSRSGGVLKLPKLLSKEAEARVKEHWSRENDGLENAHRVRILYEGAEFAQTAIPPEDAQFLQTREFQIAEIARIFRVPLHMLQAQQKSTSWGSGIEQMQLGFLQYTLQPWLLAWEQELTRKLFVGSERGRFYVRFSVDALLRGDSASRGALYGSGIQNGWLMRNEVRELEEREPIEGLDELPLPNTPAPPAGPAPRDDADDELDGAPVDDQQPEEPR